MTVEHPEAATGSSWTARELATLAAVGETFVRGGATRRARLAAQALDVGLDRAQVRQLKLALRLFELRLANLALFGRAVPFRDLTPAERERYLLTWATSRLALRRSAFQAFKKLLCFLAYADPGEGQPNPLWAEIGYRPAREPLSQEPVPIRPLSLFALPAAPDGAIELEADVAIVGSGAGGGVVAEELSRAGRSVVVLEAGGFFSEPDMPTDELNGYDRLYLDHGLTATWDGSVTILAGGTVGGGTVVNWTTCIAPQPWHRTEWASEHGIDGFDGPEIDADLAALEAELAFAEPPNVPPKDAAIARGAGALGLEAGLIRRNAEGCGDCGSCPFGCRRGAKRSSLRIHLAAAWRDGARIVPDASVQRVLIQGDRAVGVDAVVLAPGGPARLRVRAPQVVVAGGALRTPGILARSGLRHPAIGRHLRLHPVPVIGARFAEPIEMWHGTMQAIRSLQFLAPDAGRGSFTIESAPGHPGLIALAFPWESADSHAAILNRARWYAPFIAICRDQAGGHVRPTRSGGVRIDYPISSADVQTMRRGLVEMARIARAAGANELLALGMPPATYGTQGFPSGGEGRAFAAFVERLERFDFGPNRGSVFSAHQMGSARMGADPRDHACDPRGRVRSGPRSADRPIRGLYVADGSLFPTALGINPMVTVMALARRVARTTLAEG